MLGVLLWLLIQCLFPTGEEFENDNKIPFVDGFVDYWWWVLFFLGEIVGDNPFHQKICSFWEMDYIIKFIMCDEMYTIIKLVDTQSGFLFNTKVFLQ